MRPPQFAATWKPPKEATRKPQILFPFFLLANKTLKAIIKPLSTKSSYNSKRSPFLWGSGTALAAASSKHLHTDSIITLATPFFLVTTQMGREAGAFFAVARGKRVGIYRSWEKCKENILGVTYSNFKKFDNQAEAQRFISTYGRPLVPSRFKTYYAVAIGKNTGIYETWNECRDQVLGISYSKFKKFDNKKDALRFIKENRVSPFANAFSQPAVAQGSPENQLVPARDREIVEDPEESSTITVKLEEADDVVKPEEFEFEVTSTSSSGTVTPPRFRTSEMYIDGAARGNGKQGFVQAGYGVYIGPDDYRNVAVPLSDVDDVDENTPTNQRAELFALIHGLTLALRAIHFGEKFTIFTDSMYAKKCMEEWSQNWERNNWRNASGKPVANQDLIKEALRIYNEVNKAYKSNNLFHISITHVRGHQGIEGNERADKLANEGADMMKQA